MARSVANRPFKFGSKDRREFIVQDGEVEIRAENDGSGNILYLGRSKVGTAEGDSKWQISFHTWDGNDALLTRVWPQNSEGSASAEYEFSWTDRATYTYV